MANKIKLFFLAIIAVIAAFFLKDKDTNTVKDNNQVSIIDNNNTDNKDKVVDIPNDIKLSYKGKNVQITKHAQCRMDCRQINNKEIMEVLLQDKINPNKTQAAADGKCASYAYEGTTSSNKKLRIVMADCEDKGKLVTVIDLKTDFECTCN